MGLVCEEKLKSCEFKGHCDGGHHPLGDAVKRPCKHWPGYYQAEGHHLQMMAASAFLKKPWVPGPSSSWSFGFELPLGAMLTPQRRLDLKLSILCE